MMNHIVRLLPAADNGLVENSDPLSNCTTTLIRLKDDVISQCSTIEDKLLHTYDEAILDEQQKCSVGSKTVNDSIDESHLKVINAIEAYRLHMIERAKCMTQHKLATYCHSNQSC